MSFFGLPQHDLEHEKLRFGHGPLREPDGVAVYTWGEESYDGLGDALHEGGDELNDETFGAVGSIGKDFDFSSSALPEDHFLPESIPPSTSIKGRLTQNEVIQSPPPTQLPRSTSQSLEAIWDDKSPFSVLPRANGANRISEHQRNSPAPSPPRFSPFGAGTSPVISQQHPIGHGFGHNQQRARTLQEIEAEMLAAVQESRQRELLILQQRKLLEEEQHMRLLQEQERQKRLFQEQQQQQQLQRLLQHQQERTPPPRMIPVSQSPRFLEHPRQILMSQHQQEQQRLQELQEQLRFEELERRMIAQMTLQQTQDGNQTNLHRQASNLSLAEIQAAQAFHQQQRRQRSRSPAIGNHESVQHHANKIQLQQRLLSEMAQAEFSRDFQAVSQADQEALRAEAMRKIVEAEKMEEKRRKKAAKIAHMARYNDLMTQSDKDFITRIQVSQLVTQDPYAEDFYAQVYGAILRSRLGLQSQDERVIKFGSGGGVGLGLAQKGGNRRPSAMQRMEQQVERIVSNARKREEEKGLHSIHSLQGALGKTSGRSYKAAPRQLLQVDAGNASPSPTLSPAYIHISKVSVYHEGAAKEAAKLGREALGNAADTHNLVRQDPLSQRQVLTILEKLYDLILSVEQLRRDQPLPEEDEEVFLQWKTEYDGLVDQVWEELRVMIPLETSDPHPFISLLAPTKGKKILPRLTRHLSSARMLTLLTLLVACFHQLDVVNQAPVLDSLVDSAERVDAERQTQAFLGSVMQSILPVVSVANLRLATGLLGLLLDRSDIAAVAQTRPGLALLTLFLSRVEVIKQMAATAPDMSEIPSTEESQQWKLMFDHLFQLLAPHLLLLFPSTRIAQTSIAGHPNLPNPTDIADQPVWQFLAALALHAAVEQHQVLVTALREKVLDNVLSVNKGWVADENERQTKLANVNLFLHALGLDSSQIVM